MQEHYESVRQVLVYKHKRGELKGIVSDMYVEKSEAGLRKWVNNAEKGNLCWGFMVFSKGVNVNKNLEKVGGKL